jgi:hypothetical protein
MKTFQLIAKDDRLYFPHGGCDIYSNGPESYNRPELPSILFKRYEGGDYDNCPWPMVPASYSDNTVEDLRGYLASALYDEREMNPCWPNEPVIILLPDGERFDLDYELDLYYDHRDAHKPEYNPDNYGGF